MTNFQKLGIFLKWIHSKGEFYLENACEKWNWHTNVPNTAPSYPINGMKRGDQMAILSFSVLIKWIYFKEE